MDLTKLGTLTRPQIDEICRELNIPLNPGGYMERLNRINIVLTNDKDKAGPVCTRLLGEQATETPADED